MASERKVRETRSRARDQAWVVVAGYILVGRGASEVHQRAPNTQIGAPSLPFPFFTSSTLVYIHILPSNGEPSLPHLSRLES
jgi:hypothetical protein